MTSLPVLPDELWLQILSYVVTPTHPVTIEGWEDSKPLLDFNPADIDVQRSLGFLTGPAADVFVFPVFVPYIWQQFVGRTTWSLDRGGHEIREIVSEAWPRYGKPIPWAKDLEMLQKTFSAQVKHVEVVANQNYSFADEELGSEVDRALPSPQWASAMTDHVDAVLTTCSSLTSLRFFLDIERSIRQFEHYYLSNEFRDIWECTRPTKHYSSKIDDWKVDCKRMGVNFQIIARMSHSAEQDDLVEFWDLPAWVFKEEDNWADGYMTWAIEAHVARKEPGKRPRLRIFGHL